MTLSGAPLYRRDQFDAANPGRASAARVSGQHERRIEPFEQEAPLTGMVPTRGRFEHHYTISGRMRELTSIARSLHSIRHHLALVHHRDEHEFAGGDHANVCTARRKIELLARPAVGFGVEQAA